MQWHRVVHRGPVTRQTPGAPPPSLHSSPTIQCVHRPRPSKHLKVLSLLQPPISAQTDMVHIDTTKCVPRGNQRTPTPSPPLPFLLRLSGLRLRAVRVAPIQSVLHRMAVIVTLFTPFPLNCVPHRPPPGPLPAGTCWWYESPPRAFCAAMSYCTSSVTNSSTADCAGATGACTSSGMVGPVRSAAGHCRQAVSQVFICEIINKRATTCDWTGRIAPTGLQGDNEQIEGRCCRCQCDTHPTHTQHTPYTPTHPHTSTAAADRP